MTSLSLAGHRQAGRDKLERFLSKAGVLSRREAGRRIRAGARKREDRKISVTVLMTSTLA